MSKKVLRRPLTIAADAGLTVLVDAMLAVKAPRHLYVVDLQGRLCGSVSVLSVLEQISLAQGIGAGQRGDAAERVRVRDIMDLRPRYVTRGTAVAEAIQIMVRERLTELPVVDRHLHLAGEVRALDLLRTHSPLTVAEPTLAPEPSQDLAQPAASDEHTT